MRSLLTRKTGTAAVGLAAWLLLAPSSAPAHLVTTGLGPVYDGIGHLVLTPEDLVPALALALYCGLRGARISRHAIFVLPACWLLGGLSGTLVDAGVWYPFSAFSFLLLGILVASDLTLPLQVVTPVTALLGFIHGFFNGQVLKSGPGVPGLLGIMAALFVVVTLSSALVVSVKRPWGRVVVRVMGSWVAASGMLMVGWYLKGGV